MSSKPVLHAFSPFSTAICLIHYPAHDSTSRLFPSNSYHLQQRGKDDQGSYLARQAYPRMLCVARHGPFNQIPLGGISWSRPDSWHQTLGVFRAPPRYFAPSFNPKRLKRLKRLTRCPGSRSTDMRKDEKNRGSARKTTTQSSIIESTSKGETSTEPTTSLTGPGLSTTDSADCSKKEERVESSDASKASDIANSCAVALGLPSSETSHVPAGYSSQYPSPSPGATISAAGSAFAQAYLSRRKKQLIDSLMAVIREWLDRALGPLEDEEETSDGSGSGNSRSGHSKRSASASGCNTSSGGPGCSLAGQKRQLHRNNRDQNSDDEEDQEGQDRTPKRSKKDRDDSRRKFACPYYKRDPVRHNCRNCCGPGWDTVHRVKSVTSQSQSQSQSHNQMPFPSPPPCRALHLT
ncbi:hypothetical protein SODALDRAFT_39126 [Sodiomyces alkalinus F11]|uniref:Uncharacterized protein n=1 Tax=Sodiomyces alkalinus (strain CBS 110278 / VKM F-3762 / F11) TaxID=1314773 RepID=A0A3N2Q9K0_SODAK|nr:hypothetical protein SODALDRAFT_39126 [Sodiomyces alkalinus F11]ROT43439.1 hypothetical protein SODALDRAFT_39126 [Sodiomyces alkalinus F11]